MPKLTCPCGFVHDLSPIPDDGWLTVRDREFDALTPDESASPDERLRAWRRLFGLTGRLYECPTCGRLMWSMPGDNCTHFKIYRPDDDKA